MSEISLKQGLGSAEELLNRHRADSSTAKRVGLGALAAAPVAAVAPLLVGINPAYGFLVGFSCVIFSLPAALTTLSVRGHRTEELSGQWRQKTIQSLRDVSGIELTLEEFKALNYPLENPAGSHIHGSVNKFFPGEGIAKVTLVSDDGKFNLLRSKITTQEIGELQ